MVDRRSAHGVLVRKTGGNRTLGISRSRWKANNEIDLQDMEWRLELGQDLSGSLYEELAGSCECCNERPGSI
jgi:hypothetical protein